MSNPGDDEFYRLQAMRKTLEAEMERLRAVEQDVPYKDHPFMEVLKNVYEQLEKMPGARVFQKYTCSGCGARLGIDEPNTFYTVGGCDKCNAMTDIWKAGMNFTLHLDLNPEGWTPSPPVRLCISQDESSEEAEQIRLAVRRELNPGGKPDAFGP